MHVSIYYLYIFTKDFKHQSLQHKSKCVYHPIAKPTYVKPTYVKPTYVKTTYVTPTYVKHSRLENNDEFCSNPRNKGTFIMMGHCACATGDTLNAVCNETSGRQHTGRVNAVAVQRYNIPEGERLSFRVNLSVAETWRRVWGDRKNFRRPR